MAGVFILDGEGVFLNSAAQNLDMHIHLYTNNHTPVNATDTISNYTEAGFHGYASILLSGTSWGSPSVVSGKQQVTQADVTFNFTSGGSTSPVVCYGYYLTDVGDTVVIAAELFSASRTLNVGDSLTISPSMSLTTQ